MKLNKRKPVLDEREMQEMYRIEHFGLWLMYALLCAEVLLQLFMGAPLAQMGGELLVIVVVSVVMIVANARHGIWDENDRPSVRGNAAYAAAAGVCVALLLAVYKRNVGAALLSGVAVAAACFLTLGALMRYMRRRQEKQEQALDNE